MATLENLDLLIGHNTNAPVTPLEKALKVKEKHEAGEDYQAELQALFADLDILKEADAEEQKVIAQLAANQPQPVEDPGPQINVRTPEPIQ